MTEPYLILHKVRGEPAFDVAIRLEAYKSNYVTAETPVSEEVWIIPTSGHRAYPYASAPLADLNFVYEGGTISAFKDMLATPPPDDIPDHYACNTPPKPKPPSRVSSVTTDDFLV